ncbi:protein FAM183B [Echinococcus multilocularis]|uniref:Protein FAM183B n=1 Tax=Echinococcus multilocularis TaxID=6211 RepID=A0A068Y2L8_ECHMU|nr:protein FAM183B [Echinococcus multilocularis]
MGSNTEKPQRMNLNQEKIMVESIKKELRHQALYTRYKQNPFGEESLCAVIQRSRMEPKKKYTEPQTENQVYGWKSEPLVNRERNDRRFFFGRRECELTRSVGSSMNQNNSARINSRKTAQ